MKIRLTRMLMYVTPVVALVLASFWLGFREGAQVGVMVDSVSRAGISLSHLSKVNVGITRNMVTGFEGDVDLALVWAHQLDQHPLLPLLEPLWELPISHSRESLTRLASYRSTHPSPLRSEALGSEPMPDGPEAAVRRKELLDGARQNDEITSFMVKKYAPHTEAPR